MARPRNWGSHEASGTTPSIVTVSAPDLRVEDAGDFLLFRARVSLIKGMAFGNSDAWG
jgi:hypothetical protein